MLPKNPPEEDRATIIRQVTIAHLTDPNNVFIVHVNACDHCRAERDSGKPRAQRDYCANGRRELVRSIEQMDAKLAAALEGWPLSFSESLEVTVD